MEASTGHCEMLLAATADTTGVCGSANECAVHDCPQQYIPIDTGICDCVVDCMATAPVKCSQIWMDGLLCMDTACAAICP